MIPARYVRQVNQYRGKMQQTEKSCLSAIHTTSQCLLLAEKHFVPSHFNQSLPILHAFSYSHFKTHIYPFTPVLTLPRERGREREGPPASPLPTVNGSFHKHMVYTVKLLSCKCHKLSSQNVQVTQFNVMCVCVLRLTSVCNTDAESVYVCVLVCLYCAVLVLQYISTWRSLRRNGCDENSPPSLLMLHLEKVITWDINATQYHYDNNTTNSTQYSRVE